MNSQKYTRIKDLVESLSKEFSHITDVEVMEERFYIRVDGGRDAAKHIVEGFEESELLGDEYEAEVWIGPETDDYDVRIAASSLIAAEHKAEETVNHYLEKYGL